ncbi:ABC transporter ATP-binding protein [Pseudolabrys taiwanensis]|uniref:ABC transporter ATP-binding protein n=1 Tax=Pseudolabrys taiwanensis TaxID=331696 RepID=A0A345ZSL7_9HYPH|nr:ABC transporter ATP-binding protein [Pseudolabrys taiwanensis]AXK79914.1 ABC transporter ATP-binding protein [Pseudolabrys taiwanensis]
MSTPLLTVSHLTAVIGGKRHMPVLRDVSLEIGRGEVHGLVGESGAGKSTIAKAILGILPHGIRITGGSIALEGEDLLKLDPAALRRKLGPAVSLIPQDPLTALNPGRRIEAQLTDGLRLWKGMSAKQAHERALQLLEEVQMREPARVMRSFPHELSGGMRQRVLIAAAFALEPKLVIADEPTTALDVTVQKQILRLIRNMQERHGTGVVFVTHDLGVVAQICDRATLLYMGKVMEQGLVRDLLDQPRHAYTKALMAACPRYDEPGRGLAPVPEAVFAACRAEIAAFDREVQP